MKNYLVELRSGEKYKWEGEDLSDVLAKAYATETVAEVVKVTEIGADTVQAKLFQRIIEMSKVSTQLQMKVDYSKKSYQSSKAFREYLPAQTRVNELYAVIYHVLDLGKEFEIWREEQS